MINTDKRNLYIKRNIIIIIFTMIIIFSMLTGCDAKGGNASETKVSRDTNENNNTTNVPACH